MKTELAPLAFGTASINQDTMLIGAIILAVIMALVLGARREIAMFAVFAGIVGVILSA